MLIKRIYNNNVALADDDGREVVVIGRGLCYAKRPGDAIDSSLTEKIFTLQDQRELSRFEKIVRSIPSNYLLVAEEIVNMLKRESNLAFDDGLLIALADHISTSLEREKQGVVLANPFLFEIKHVYRKEFALASRAAEIIHEHLDIWISDEEIGFIALHIISATVDSQAGALITSMEMVQGILGLVTEFYKNELDSENIAYERFLRHLMFFAQRALENTSYQQTVSLPLLLNQDEYADAFSCADNISNYVEHTYGIEVTDTEKNYLVYHLANLTNSLSG